MHMKNSYKNFKGSFVAIVTPFDANGKIDYLAFETLLDFHLANQTNGIVVCGTTGETPTLLAEENSDLIKFTIQHIDGRIPIIAGSGSNSTQVALKNSLAAQENGADALMIAAPYYNKPTPKGLFLHFEYLATRLDTPIIVYNVPSRTGVNMSGELIVNLGKQFDNIVGVKEASGDLSQIKYILDHCPDDFILFSGDDNLAIDVVAEGGVGCISVAANEIPAAFSQMMKSALDGKFDQARSFQKKYARLMELNFIESNPIPVKTALHQMGLIQNNFRLPMCTMENPTPLIEEMQRLGLVK